ncbi:hypothetical protein BKA69DRAFT_814206 [Paraphysoderma sedebokerense]|nr:hypothetical protein BKA69DRAFT_814206 [Paraphysoderma sedebokerense]
MSSLIMVFTAIHFILFTMEVLHSYWHCLVLTTGMRLTPQKLYSRSWYFMWDLTTVLLSNITLSPKLPDPRLSSLPVLSSLFNTVFRMFAYGHTIQHVYYVLGWFKAPYPKHVKTVVEWSVLNWKEKGKRQDHWWKTMGTGLDIVTHLLMAGMHLYVMGRLTGFAV